MISKLKVEAEPPLWLTCRSGLIPFYNQFGFVDATGSGDLPPYFRRIRGLARVLMTLAGARQTLAVMVWPDQDKPDGSPPRGPARRSRS